MSGGPTKGTKYQKRPCRCCKQQITTTRIQIRLREIDSESRRDTATLASRTASLCDACGWDAYAQIDEIVAGLDSRAEVAA